jgi:hypothetical protein
MRVPIWIFTLRYKVCWLFCVFSAACFADWKRDRRSRSEIRRTKLGRVRKFEERNSNDETKKSRARSNRFGAPGSEPS